ncbi:50S ribosomal protein L18, partial [Candidatus Woesearchaeota archaeon]|nr:50S ribosomal protein L18 [Candidatus Woesearchaeota archaeon]
MTTGKYVAFRRRREGKTDYKKRRLLLSSRENIRLVIRTSLKHTLCQLITYEPQGDKVLITIDSKALIKLGWPYHTGSVPAAYLTGILLGKKAKEKKITQAILDIGLHPSIKGNRVYAA